MIYYRIAAHKRQSTEWEWKTEVVTSLEEVFRLRQEYHFLSAEQLRVFMASSVIYLNALMARENLGLPSNSLTLDQLLLDHHSITLARIRHFELGLGWSGENVPELPEIPEQADALEPAMVSESINEATETTEAVETVPTAAPETAPALEQDHEPGGGDHDIPYTFAFPQFLPHALAWLQLRERVLSGELVS